MISCAARQRSTGRGWAGIATPRGLDDVRLALVPGPALLWDEFEELPDDRRLLRLLRLLPVLRLLRESYELVDPSLSPSE